MTKAWCGCPAAVFEYELTDCEVLFNESSVSYSFRYSLLSCAPEISWARSLLVRAALRQAPTTALVAGPGGSARTESAPCRNPVLS